MLLCFVFITQSTEYLHMYLVYILFFAVDSEIVFESKDNENPSNTIHSVEEVPYGATHGVAARAAICLQSVVLTLQKLKTKNK